MRRWAGLNGSQRISVRTASRSSFCPGAMNTGMLRRSGLSDDHPAIKAALSMEAVPVRQATKMRWPCIDEARSL